MLDLTTAEDVLVGMASYLPEDKTRFRYTGPVAFSEFLKNHNDLSVVEDYFTFSPSGISRELEQAISNLGLEILNGDGSRKEMWFDLDAVREEMSETPEPYRRLDKDELSTLAEAFLNEVVI